MDNIDFFIVMESKNININDNQKKIIHNRLGYNFLSNYIEHYRIDMKINNDIFYDVNFMSLIDILKCEQEPIKTDLFTCSCGVPECLGYYSGLNCFVKDEKMIWNPPKDYDMSQIEYLFDNKILKEKIRNIFQEMLILELKNILPTYYIHSTDILEDFFVDLDISHIQTISGLLDIKIMESD